MSMMYGPELGQWRDWMTAGNMSEDTIRLRLSHVRQVLSSIGMLDDPLAVTYEQLLTFFARQSWQPNTRRSYRASMRTFYGWARDFGLVAVSPAHHLPRVPIPRSWPRPVSEDGYRAAQVGCPRNLPFGDLLIAVLLAGDYGLRRSEIARSRREDLEPDLVGWALRVVGKGGHERMVPVTADLAAMILSRPPGWLFPSPRRAGRHVTADCIARYIAERLPGKFSTHSLRHRCATVALQGNGGDLRAVQELLGHAKPDTTALYTLIPDSAVRNAMMVAADKAW